MAIKYVGAKRLQGLKQDRVSDSLGSSGDGTNTGVTLNPAWTFTDSAFSQTGGEMKYVASGGEDYIQAWRDFGSTLSDTTWTCRFTTQSSETSANPFTFFGLSSNTSELDQNQDFIGYEHRYNDNKWGVVYADGSSVPLTSNSVTNDSSTYYVEIKRTADDTVTMNIWTGSFGGTLVDSETRTDIPTTVVGLRYIKFSAKDNYSQTVVWDNLQIWNGTNDTSGTPDLTDNFATNASGGQKLGTGC